VKEIGGGEDWATSIGSRKAGPGRASSRAKQKAAGQRREEREARGPSGRVQGGYKQSNSEGQQDARWPSSHGPHGSKDCGNKLA